MLSSGEAEAIYRRADATAKGLNLVSEAVTTQGGAQAASLRVAEQYLAAFAQIAKTGNTILLPASTNDPASMVAQAMSIYRTLANGNGRSPALPECALQWGFCKFWKFACQWNWCSPEHLVCPAVQRG